MTKFLTLIVLLMPALCFAQGGGHVGRHRGEQQQQQQMTFGVDTYSLADADEAKALYEVLLSQGSIAADRSDSCTLPVKVIQGKIDYKEVTCFDRGDEFNGSRYKCYIKKHHGYTMQMFSRVRSWFVRKPSFCGGDGNHQIKQK